MLYSLVMVILDSDFQLLIPFAFFNLFVIIISIISLDYAVRLKNAYVDENFIIIEGLNKKEKISLSNIKKITLHKFFFMSLIRPFVITFENKTSFGSKIYIYPTITDKDKKIDFFLEIREELEEMVEKQKGKNNLAPTSGKPNA